MFPNNIPIPQPKPAVPQQQQATTPAAAPPSEGGDLRSGWQTFLSDPANRAGLLQFGLSMLAGNPENSLAQNIGQSLGEGFAARGEAQQMQVAQDAEGRKEARQKRLDDSQIALRSAQAARALRPPQSRTSTSGQVTPKDYAKEWIKFVKDARKNEDERTIAELRSEFNEMWGAATTPPGIAAPSATSGSGAQAAAINQMTLEQLKALDVTKMTPDELKAASSRYKALGGT